MENGTLHARLMEDARRYDPAEHHRTLLAPFRDVILLWRAKFMSYEQISASLSRHGLKVSPASVGVFCRKHYTRAEILRERQRIEVDPKSETAVATPAGLAAQSGKRGPRIARDNY